MREESLEDADIPKPEEEEIILPEAVEDAPKVAGGKIVFWGMIVLLTVAAFFGLWYFNREQVWVTRGLRSVIQIYEKNNLPIPSWLLRWARWSEINPVARAFYGVNTSLRLLGEKTPPHFTPQERAAVLIKVMPENEGEIRALLAEHQKALYTPNDGDLKIAQHASRVIRWQAIRRKLS